MAKGVWSSVKVKLPGEFAYYHEGRKIKCVSNFPMWLVHLAWDRGCDFEDLADGYGEGMGTHGDWSGIRDSTRPARDAMFARAVEFLGLAE